MASIRKRGTKWQVQIRRDGSAPVTKTFTAREDAIRWGRDQDRRIDAGELVGQKDATIAELIDLYQRKITPLKKSAAIEPFYWRQVARHPIAAIRIRNLKASDIVEYRDFRLQTVSGSTVRKELGLIANMLKLAAHEWGYVNRLETVRQVRKPPPERSRERRLKPGEFQALQRALAGCKNLLFRDLTLFALATGMRRGEILALRWDNVSFRKRTAFLPITKNGESREVPLSPAALDLLKARKNLGNDGSAVFPISANAVRLAWERVKRRAKIGDLRFHDLRHEAISRFFELGLSVPEVGLISGHKDKRMLFRYTHLRSVEVLKKLG